MTNQRLKKLSSDEQMRYKYLDREKARRDEISRISYAEKIGFEKGREEGRKEGVEQIVRSMLNKGMKIEEVAALTHLEVSRIANIATAPESTPKES